MIPRTRLTFAAKLAFGFAALLLMIAAVAATTLVISTGVQNEARLAKQESMVFAGNAREMKFDALQIQQWLSDVSATRGLDGLDDGFQKADDYRKSAQAILAKFRELYRRKEGREQLEKIDQIEQKLQAYYEIGKTMAQAYVDGGPSSGNKFMERFDAAADELCNSMDPFVEEQVGEFNAAMQSIAASAGRLSKVTLVVALLAWSLGLVWSWSITRSIVQPVKHAVAVMRTVAQGDLTVRLDGSGRDEMAQMAVALNHALESMGSAVSSIAHNAQSVAASSEELSSVSRQLSSNSEETATQAGVVSMASEQVSKNVQTVAAGAEEMTASINEIAKNTSEAARVSTEAVSVAEKTNATIAKLGDSSAEIGNVIKVITSIAEQTNLLALNATIEAARAGEAGTGFAVVANEVKELARQTRQATEDISNRIRAIQGSTQESVQAIGRIVEVIGQVNLIAQTIASAVEEQSVTTNEMSRSIAEAAKGTDQIVRNITGLAHAAQTAASGATETQASAQELARFASELQAAVGQFRCDAKSREPTSVG